MPTLLRGGLRAAPDTGPSISSLRFLVCFAAVPLWRQRRLASDWHAVNRFDWRRFVADSAVRPGARVTQHQRVADPASLESDPTLARYTSFGQYIGSRLVTAAGCGMRHSLA